jgi:hypothetical protein
VDWIGVAKDRNRWRELVNLVLNLQVPWNAGKLSSGLASSGLSSSVQLSAQLFKNDQVSQNERKTECDLQRLFSTQTHLQRTSRLTRVAVYLELWILSEGRWKTLLQGLPGNFLWFSEETHNTWTPWCDLNRIYTE